MKHPASGLRNIVHGHGLAGKRREVYPHFQNLRRRDCHGLLKTLDLNMTLTQLGRKREDGAWMAENCMKISTASVSNHPVVFTREEIGEIYRK